MKNPKKIAICGYYGRGNLGDEMILKAILSQIKKASPRADIQILNTKNPLTNAQKMLGADLFIFGGGSILQNASSDASLLYYLAIARLASLLCKRKIMLANGIGPIIPRKIPQKILLCALARTVNCFDYISVRDTTSQKLLQNLLPNRKIHLVPDPTITLFKKIKHSLTSPSASTTVANIKTAHKINRRLTSCTPPTQQSLFFVFCPHANSLKNAKIPTKILSKSLSAIASFHHASPKVVIFNEKEDLPLAQSLQKLITNAKIIIPRTTTQAAHALLGAKFVISSRYHASLLAISLDVPSLSISTDPKITALAPDFNTFPAQPPQILKNSPILNNKILEMLKHHETNKDKISRKINNISKPS